jgi:hypothetical protein
MRSDARPEARTATVVNFVAAKASHFNSFQYAVNFPLLNLKEFCEERRVDNSYWSVDIAVRN